MKNDQGDRAIYTIAIQPDKTPLVSGQLQSFSERWITLARQKGFSVRLVDVYDEDNFFSQIQGVDAFMWAFWNAPPSRGLGMRVINALNHTRKLATYPNWQTSWFFEDKLSQRYLFEAGDIPSPKTWVFWKRKDAERFIQKAQFPLVLKLAFGICSDNVCLVKNEREAAYWVDRLFSEGLNTLEAQAPKPFYRVAAKRVWDATKVLFWGARPGASQAQNIQKGCVLFQEFVPGNDSDVRVIVIGHRAFAFRRINRPGDFRASGSGLVDWDPLKIDLSAITLAFKVAKALGSQAITLDIIWREDVPVVVEISYYFEAWGVYECPGHWVSKAGTFAEEIEWVDGRTRAEDAIFDDLLMALEQRQQNGAAATEALPGQLTPASTF